MSNYVITYSRKVLRQFRRPVVAGISVAVLGVSAASAAVVTSGPGEEELPPADATHIVNAEPFTSAELASLNGDGESELWRPDSLPDDERPEIPEPEPEPEPEIEAEEQTESESEPEEQEETQSAPEPESSPECDSYSGNRNIACNMLADFDFGQDQFNCLDNLWERESNWDETAQNPSSGAYGIPQSLPGDKMASSGGDWQSNPATQIHWGLEYISDRYGQPCEAWAHSEANGWY